jgi:hypothetical protein
MGLAGESTDVKSIIFLKLLRKISQLKSSTKIKMQMSKKLYRNDIYFPLAELPTDMKSV